MDDNGNLHSAKTTTVSTNEVISLGFVQRYKILPAAPVSHCTFRCTVIVSGLVHFKHIVLRFLIPKGCTKQREYYSYYDFSKKKKKKKGIKVMYESVQIRSPTKKVWLLAQIV